MTETDKILKDLLVTCTQMENDLSLIKEYIASTREDQIEYVEDMIAQCNLIDSSKDLTIEEHNDMRRIRFSLIQLKDRMCLSNGRTE